MLQAIPSRPPIWHPAFIQGTPARKKEGAAIGQGAKVQGTTEGMPSPEALADLLSAVGATQDRAAFAVLFRHFAPRIKSYLRKAGGDPAAAEEAMQEAMVRIWHKARLFDPTKASAATWIFTVARNVRIDAIRKDRRPEFDPSDPAFVPDEDEPPDVVLMREQSADNLKAAMATLSEAEQTALHLAFFEDMAHSAIAKQLGIPLGTVKSRLRLAFGKLRRALSQAEGVAP